MKLKNSGLLPTPYDERDLKLGAITELPDLSELPTSFELGGVTIRDQKRTDFCTQFAACGMSALQEGVELSAEWAFAKSKEGEDVDAFGQDIRKAMRVHVKHGVPKKEEVPFSVDTHDSHFLRRIENYPDLDQNAIQHIKKSYLQVTGPYDHFDNIRATLWKYREEKRGVISGLFFGWPSSQEILDTIPVGGEPHALYYLGWKTIKKKQYLVAPNSYGKKAGDNGVHYISREVVNHFVSRYNAYMFLDMDPATVRYMIENGIKDRDNWLIQLMKTALTLMKQLIQVKKNR